MTGRFASAVVALLAAGGGAFAQPAPVSTPPAAEVPPPVGVTSAPVVTDEAYAPVADERPGGRLWAEADLLFWWMKGASLPALATSSPAGTPQAQAGVIGSGAKVVFGGDRVNDDLRIGTRLLVGGWFDREQTIGVEASFLGLSNNSKTLAAGSDGTNIISRPFINATTGLQSSELVSFPGVLSGSVSAVSKTDGLLGAGVLFRENLCCGPCWRLDVLGGYRFLQFNDRLGITENLTAISGANQQNVPAGTLIRVSDRFDASNNFHGFDFGLAGEYRRGPFQLRWLTKLAVGENSEIVEINGNTTTTTPGGTPVSNVGGLLALQSNVGRLERQRGIVVPELGVQIGYQVNSSIRVHAGYTGLYWSEAVWAGKNIDLQVNPNLLPPVVNPGGPFRPQNRFEGTSLWAQGLDVGVEFRY